jgi:hypothetical protein
LPQLGPSTSLSDADHDYGELVKVRRLMVPAFQQSMASPGISANPDATQAVARLGEEEKGTQRSERAARFAAIALQMQGAVSEAAKVADEAGLEWPVLHPVRPLPGSGSRRLEPAGPLEVRYPEAAFGEEGACDAVYYIGARGVPVDVVADCTGAVFRQAARETVEGRRYKTVSIEVLLPGQPLCRAGLVLRPPGAE